VRLKLFIERVFNGPKSPQYVAINHFTLDYRDYYAVNIIFYNKSIIMEITMSDKVVEMNEWMKEVKRLCKEFGFTARMLKGSLAEGRKKQ